MPTTKLELARQIAAKYGEIPLVRAVAVGGSTVSQTARPGSDIDMYVYIEHDIPVENRIAAAEPYRNAEFDVRFWETADNYTNADTGYELGVMYRWVSWAESELDRIFVNPVAHIGYTTAVWHNIRTSIPMFDRDGWFANIQARADQPYPEALRRAIIEKNARVIRPTMFSYMEQVEKALARGDLLHINNRISALFDCYFDILFALNRQTHPGQKRLLHFAETLCPNRPEGLQSDIETVIRLGGTGDAAALDMLHHLLDQLNPLLIAEGFSPT